jgi:hybrid cluster-associated redox disulfide protein
MVKTAKKTIKKTVKKTEKKQLIGKDMTLEQVINKFPEAVPILFKHGLHCIGCHIAATETIEQASLAHGIDLKVFLKDLNEAAGKK